MFNHTKLLRLTVLAGVLVGLMLVGIVRADEIPYGQLSKHFNKQEFNQKQNPLPLREFKISPLLVVKLETLRSLISDKPVYITSGYRTPEYNKIVGGAPRSQHLKGNAADIYVNNLDLRTLEQLAEQVGFSFIKRYSRHLHVDVR